MPPLLFLAVALTSFTGLILEIALTRLLSILFFYNYVFVILSVAMLGIGVGAAVVHQWQTWANSRRLGWLALAAGGSVAGVALMIAALVGVDGRIALKMYDELTLTRAFVTAVSALRQEGISQETAVRHIVVLLDPDLVSAQDPLHGPMLLVYRQPITPEQGKALLADIQQAGFIPVFVPHAQERPPLSLLASGETTLDELVAGFSRGDISATVDDAPFFYEFRRGLPDLLRQLNTGLAVLLLAGIGYLTWRRRAVQRGPFWQVAAYFALLGAGFIR